MIRRLLTDSLRMARDGASRATSAGIRALRRVNAALDPEGGTRTGAPRPGSVTPEVVARFRELLGVDEDTEGDDVHDEEVLRQRFAELLELSQEPTSPPGTHPAFERIVEQISPDEARILRLLGSDGPQPVISVIATPRLGWGSQTLVQYVSLVGDHAGCHEPDRTPAYIDNLGRLGVTRVFEEELVGDEDYEVLEVQPEVQETEERITEEMNQRAKCVRKRLALTGLGKQFIAVCLPEQ